MLMKTMTLGMVAALATFSPKWTAILRPVEDKGPKGSATAEVGANTTRVTLELSGAKPGSTLPWHIHSGSCNAMGKVWGEPSMYPPLEIGAQGAASGAVTLPVVLPSNGEFAVSVHRSPEDMAPVACGALLQVPMPDTLRPMRP